MSSEPNAQASEEENQKTVQTPGKDHWDEATTDDLLETRVDSESVVGFIENNGAVHGLSSSRKNAKAAEPAPVESVRKYQSKAVTAILQKLDRVEKYPDLTKQVFEDPVVAEWLNRDGCKQKEIF